MFPYKFIAIEGNIGAGKTTLSKMIHKESSCKLILEQFTDNPFLPFFYEDPKRYSLPVELFFMTERHKQLQKELSQSDLFSDFILSDYYFIKTLLFAKNNLNEEEYRLFKRLFNVLNSTFPEPELIVYLYRSVDNLLENIKNRGREYEQGIKGKYLDDIQKAYLNYFRSIDNIPIVIVDIEDSKFWDNPNEFESIKKVLQRTDYKLGMNYISIK
jgi:deoxyguanosine kinase